jgi:hypothetical protein
MASAQRPKRATLAIFACAWRDQVTGYALLSKAMDPANLDRLAEAVVRLTDPSLIVYDGIRAALRDVTRVGMAFGV